MKKIFIITIILLIFIPNFCNGSETDSQDVLNSQQEELNISKFIKKAQKYTEDTFEDINVDRGGGGGGGGFFKVAITCKVDNNLII